MFKKQLRDSLDWALMVALVFGVGAIAQAQEKETQPEGRIVQIGPGDAQSTPVTEGVTTKESEPGQTPEPAAPKFWIGLLGGPVSPELRAHLDIPEDQGVMIRDIVPDSPAAEAGLQMYDVLLAANGTPLHTMGDLVELVRAEGENQGQIDLEVLRHGQVEAITITPTERPAQIAQQGHGAGTGPMEGWGQPGMTTPEELLRHFGQRFRGPEGRALEFRSFGPGMIVGDQTSALAELPDGVSISVQREGGQKPHITVKRGEETWNIDGDDPASLEQLPEDLRPFVAQMLHGTGGIGLEVHSPSEVMPTMPWVGEAPAMQGQELGKRIEALERKIEELQKQLSAPADEDSR